MGATIAGLVSGLNTTQIIAQLMQVERLPEQAMTQSQANASNMASVLQNLNGLVASLQTAATAFAPDSVLTPAVWSSTTATSSNSATATATTGSTAVPGSATFTVTQVATASSSVSGWNVGSTSTQIAPANGALLVSKGAASVGFQSIDGGSSLGSSNHTIAVKDLGGGNFDIVLDGSTTTHNYISSPPAGVSLTLNGDNGLAIAVTPSGSLKAGTATTTSVATGSGSLADIVAGINAAGAGVQATAVGVSSTAYKLQLASTTTGAASDISLNPGAFNAQGYGDLTQLTAGQDTVLHVGSSTSGFDVTSPTNTVSTLLPGVTITAQALSTSPVTVTVASDASGMADKMQALVDAANGALSFISRNSAYDTNSKTAQPLLGNSMTSQLAQKITDAVIGDSTNTPAMNGVSVQKDGTIAFDRTAFLNAYAENPSSVQTTMTAMAASLRDQAKQASDPIDGYLTGQITSEQATVKDYTSQIADFEQRMTLKQQSLQQQYANLETALGTLQSQSQWLSGQLGSLMTTSTSSK